MAAALRARDGELNAPLAQALFDVSYVLGSYGIGVGFGLLVLAVSVAGVRGVRLLRRPIALVGLGVAVALITPVAGSVIGEYTVVPALVVVLLVGVGLLRGERPPSGEDVPGVEHEQGPRVA